MVLIVSLSVRRNLQPSRKSTDLSRQGGRLEFRAVADQFTVFPTPTATAEEVLHPPSFPQESLLQLEDRQFLFVGFLQSDNAELSPERY